MNLENLKSKLEKLAKKETLGDNNCNAYEASGGNYDDAYGLGFDDGEVSLAREILKELNG